MLPKEPDECFTFWSFRRERAKLYLLAWMCASIRLNLCKKSGKV